MRKFIFLIFAVFWLGSCTKQTEAISCIEGTVDKERVWGTTTSNSNLMDWSKASIDLNNIPLIESKFDLKILSQNNNFNSNLTISNGGDAIAEQYELIDTIDNFLKVTEIKNDSIIGEYSLYYKVAKSSIGRGQYDTSLPKILYFKNGFFTAKFIK
jgi:hypothetical protein